MSAVRGLWFDGRSSRGCCVAVERDGDSLRLRADDGRDERWPLREVALNPRLGNTPRILRRAGHGQVECADAPELAQWFPRPPSRLEAAADWLERRRPAIAVSALLTVLATVAFVRDGVPWIAARVAERMPVAVERQLSDQVVAVLERTHLRPSRLPAALARSCGSSVRARNPAVNQATARGGFSSDSAPMPMTKSTTGAMVLAWRRSAWRTRSPRVHSRPRIRETTG